MQIGHLVSGLNIINPLDQVNKMNILTNAILINQSDRFTYDRFQNGRVGYDFYSFDERGVGLSRNNALMRSQFDISIISDEDMVYTKDYLDIIRKAYKRFPSADMIVFNVRVHDQNGIHDKVTRVGKVHSWNALRYGTATFTFKTEVIKKNNITFSLLFGGGAKYSSGEDSLFIWECINKGLNVISVNETIADVYNTNSTWFEGYNKKYFRDKGSLFYALSPLLHNILIFQFLVRKKSLYKDSYDKKTVLKLLLEGVRSFKSNSI
ncbi:hypothetical protein NE293_05880 [Latilactobacillus curvatus]|uniref:Glycosyl transferase, group 2 family protein n=1 Tax=Ligilactobacillus acidipiscis TaxID=89059 RepID=A0A1K1KW40_9LACO|nr:MULTISPECIES: hypothetical protein [Lactobacillaceae]MCM6844201.1 hypothetical protein [Latilactobacillus curvatus]MCM6860912.1 hypothetical protein [Latilactobacillus curvatus]MCM6868210.1 hypothetical protein [Latilactobacillus curvatus]SFV41708.1 Glycosyl transferase, group 2 family protein [Ligilactobacillus acidipiscis]